MNATTPKQVVQAKFPTAVSDKTFRAGAWSWTIQADGVQLGAGTSSVAAWKDAASKLPAVREGGQHAAPSTDAGDDEGAVILARAAAAYRQITADDLDRKGNSGIAREMWRRLSGSEKASVAAELARNVAGCLADDCDWMLEGWFAAYVLAGGFPRTAMPCRLTASEIVEGEIAAARGEAQGMGGLAWCCVPPKQRWGIKMMMGNAGFQVASSIHLEDVRRFARLCAEGSPVSFPPADDFDGDDLSELGNQDEQGGGLSSPRRQVDGLEQSKMLDVAPNSGRKLTLGSTVPQHDEPSRMEAEMAMDEMGVGAVSGGAPYDRREESKRFFDAIRRQGRLSVNIVVPPHATDEQIVDLAKDLAIDAERYLGKIRFLDFEVGPGPDWQELGIPPISGGSPDEDSEDAQLEITLIAPEDVSDDEVVKMVGGIAAAADRLHRALARHGLKVDRVEIEERLPPISGGAPEPELLPCPFCGGKAGFQRQGTRRQSCIVECEDCGCRLEGPDEGDKSGSQWNARVPHPDHAAVMADMRLLFGWSLEAAGQRALGSDIKLYDHCRRDYEEMGEHMRRIGAYLEVFPFNQSSAP